MTLDSIDSLTITLPCALHARVSQVFVNIETHELSDRDADHYLDETDHDPSLASALESQYNYKDSVSIDRSTPGDGERDENVESGTDVGHGLR